MKSELLYFKVAGVNIKAVNIPTSNTTTDSIDLQHYFGPIFITVTRSASNGVVDFYIECSNDNINFVRYAPVDYGSGGTLTKTQDAYPVQTSGANIDMNIPAYFQDQMCIPAFIRIVFQISGGPTGTYTVSLRKTRL